MAINHASGPLSIDGILGYPFHATSNICKDKYSLIKLHCLSAVALPKRRALRTQERAPLTLPTPPCATVETCRLIATQVGQSPECSLRSWFLYATTGRRTAGSSCGRNRIVYVVSGGLGGFVRVKLWSRLSVRGCNTGNRAGPGSAHGE